MVRGTTVRWVLTALSVLLLALQLFTPTPSFASAHRTQLTAAGSPEPVTHKRADDTDETVLHGGTGHPAVPAGPLRTRDRHRTAVEPVPGNPAPMSSECDAPAARPAAPHISRPSTAHTPAALQVFRC
ncbi:hypothetical protein [Streptomyces sp. NPDC052036]|uniref:hypothetical protein n=1 Tax=Streptomyces sp. NPDC052036 TaxID=3155171 RepID=UPI003444F09E